MLCVWGTGEWEGVKSAGGGSTGGNEAGEDIDVCD